MREVRACRLATPTLHQGERLRRRRAAGRRCGSRSSSAAGRGARLRARRARRPGRAVATRSATRATDQPPGRRADVADRDDAERSRPSRRCHRAVATIEARLLDALDRDLVGLAPVKAAHPRDRRAPAGGARARGSSGCPPAPPALHMSFTGNPGTGQDHGRDAHGGDPPSARLRAQGPSRGRDARRPRRPVHRAHRAEDQGGAEARDGRRPLHRRGVLPLPARERARLRPGGDRDPAAGHGGAARRPGGDPRRLPGPHGARSSSATPGCRSRIAHHLEFPDYTHEELLAIAERMLEAHALPAERRRGARRSASTSTRRMRQPRFANARSVRNALDRARLRQASRLFDAHGAPVSRETTSMTLEAEDFRGEPRLRRRAAIAEARVMTHARRSTQFLSSTAPAPRRDARSPTAPRRCRGRACKRIAARRRRRARWRARSARPGRPTCQGERQKKLDVLANEILRAAPASGAARSPAIASEELDGPAPGPAPSTRAAATCVAFDPLDGSSNIDVNVSVGSIFSVLRAAAPATGRAPRTSCSPAATALRRLRHLRPVDHARAHRSATASHGFTLDRELGEFVLTHPDLRDPAGRRASSRSTRRTSASGSRRSGATSTSASPAGRARAATTSTCAGSPRWSPRSTAS